MEVCLTLILIGIFIFENNPANNFIFPYLKAAGIPSLNIWQSLLESPDAKIHYFVMLLAPLIFFPLLDPLMWILSIPFVASTLFSQNEVYWQVFGLHYPMSWVPILFLGIIRGISKLSFSFHGTHHDFTHKEITRFISTLLLFTTLIFAVVFSPIGPLNPYIKGGYWAGNADLYDIMQVNTAKVFLHEAITLVPQNASVITQNDIPQLSGRYHFQVVSDWAGGYTLKPVISYDYILANSQTGWFPPILPYIIEGLQNGSFGILAMGYGTILLKKGYTGDPVLFVPFRDVWTPEKLQLYSGYNIGNIIVHNSSEHDTDFSFWYGPHAFLPLGVYVANFTLMVQNIVPKNASIITLDVVSKGGDIIYSTKTLKLGDFSRSNEWETFSLEFKLTNYTTGVEFRGMFVTNATTISMADISLYQISTNPK
jgi:hypothetical protein